MPDLTTVKSELPLITPDPARGDTLTRLVLFPAYAFQKLKEPKWKAEISGVAFCETQQRIKRKILLKVLQRVMDVPQSQMQGDLFERRVRPFFCAPRNRQKIHLDFGSNLTASSKRSRRGGHFRAMLKMSNPQMDQFLTAGQDSVFHLKATVTSQDDPPQSALAAVQVIPPKGLTVISDIDDTIKESNVGNRRELLINTFLKDYRSVPGMSDIYRRLAAESGAAFHYVSASPWQLFDSLQEFRESHLFPPGSMHLRKVRLSDQVLKRLTVLKRGGKTKVIRKIIKRFPQRQFLLIGDSVEMDPQIYLKLLQAAPDQIQGILIRLVSPNHVYRESMRELKQLRTPGFDFFEDAVELAEKLENIGLISNHTPE